MDEKRLKDIATVNQRAWDLLRFCRSELHIAKLISDDEYVLLARDHAAVERLENYDRMFSFLSVPLPEDANKVMDRAERACRWFEIEGDSALPLGDDIALGYINDFRDAINLLRDTLQRNKVVALDRALIASLPANVQEILEQAALELSEHDGCPPRNLREFSYTSGQSTNRIHAALRLLYSTLARNAELERENAKLMGENVELMGENVELRERLKEVKDIIPEVFQLFDSWDADGTAWSEWYESVRNRLVGLVRERALLRDEPTSPKEG